MRILSLDIETGQSFDVETPVNPDNFITEIGAVLWDTETNKPLDMMSMFVNEGKPQSQDCLEYTGITQEEITEFGVPLKVAITRLLEMQDKAEYLLTQNGGNFDLPLLEYAFKRVGYTEARLKKGIDTRIDIKYPNHIAQRSLIYLAAAHGFINPFPHRAVMDSLTAAKIFSMYPLEEVLKVALSPKVKLKAQFTYPKENRLGNDLFKKKMIEFNQCKDKVKKLGFQWHPDSKTWVLESKEELVKDMDFPCPVVKI